MNETMTEPEIKALIIAAFEAERKREDLESIKTRSRLNILERKMDAVEALVDPNGPGPGETDGNEEMRQFSAAMDKLDAKLEAKEKQ